jgi:hypothetical protein
MFSSPYANACTKKTVGSVTVFTPCAKPTESCPKPPSGPGTAHLGNIPGTNVQIHGSFENWVAQQRAKEKR